MTRALTVLAWTMGVACALIGVAHMAVGPEITPGTAPIIATDDSQNRFFGAIFAGYGLAWIWAIRRTPVATDAIRWLAGIFFLGGLARLISLAVYGWPHWFIVALGVIELVLPPVFFWLTKSADTTRHPAHPTATVPT
ncbi:DUF4345 domain-containing protein [Nocardia donostiensis]|uniref:DUF4345 domain-containing protein n=1 Tax=Nocardia donostiensis TaxID=1538463 RepID=A0A1V2TE72_9NOCA|nr:DUF4345 domain-containing protein [Nocardia donostiensis]ONM47820.1 hypothetical protein B0T46_16435 [Nocardia donostiensis]OQS13750.1 hypothetical protein B0T36_18770 [Nocardia donostiensis]OQS22572.1 hypothetical protein B0T44_05495 [Nocardia donostiensis]